MGVILFKKKKRLQPSKNWYKFLLNPPNPHFGPFGKKKCIDHTGLHNKLTIMHTSVYTRPCWEWSMCKMSLGQPCLTLWYDQIISISQHWFSKWNNKTCYLIVITILVQSPDTLVFAIVIREFANYLTYRIVSNKRSPSNKRPPNLFSNKTR